MKKTRMMIVATVMACIMAFTSLPAFAGQQTNEPDIMYEMIMRSLELKLEQLEAELGRPVPRDRFFGRQINQLACCDNDCDDLIWNTILANMQNMDVEEMYGEFVEGDERAPTCCWAPALFQWTSQRHVAQNFPSNLTCVRVTITTNQGCNTCGSTRVVRADNFPGCGWNCGQSVR